MKKQLLTLAINAILPSAVIGNDDIMLNTSYGSLDEVPETFRSLYSEQDGRAVLSKVVGLKTQDDINRLQGALEKERNDHRQVKSMLSKLGDRDIEDVLKDLDSIPALKAAAKGADNLDEQIASRLQQETAPLQRQLGEYESRVGELESLVNEYKTREVHRDINDVVGKFATKSKAIPEAIEDIQFMARSIFEKNEAGQVVAKADIPGVTPGISPEVWLVELQQNKPYLWPQSNLPNLGKGGKGAGGANPWSKDGWNMTEQGRILRENRTKAEQLAAQAGTKIGGPKPQ